MTHFEKLVVEELPSPEFIQRFLASWQNEELTYRPFLYLKNKEQLDQIGLIVRPAKDEPIGFAHVDKSDQLLLSPMPQQAVECLCRYLIERNILFPGIFGPEREARNLARSLETARGPEFHIAKRLIHWKLYKLKTQPKTSGSARRATLCEAETIAEMFDNMQRETNTQRPFDSQAMVKHTLDDRHLYVWEMANGQIGCIAIVTLGSAETKHGTIERVFTPMPHRGNGFARALIWNVANTMLDQKPGVFLSSDADEFVPTKLYQGLGFETHSTMVNLRQSLHR